MFLNSKNLFLLAIVVLLTSFISYMDFPFIRMKLLDLSQLFNSQAEISDTVKTVNIRTTNKLKRPFDLVKIKLVFDKIQYCNPKKIILMISPKEIIESNLEKKSIFNFFQTLDNLYLFSPYTNGPLGGFSADPIFNKYPRHFRMPLTRDILFGAKDSKIRRIILSYSNKGVEPFVFQLEEILNKKIDISKIKYTFDLWDTTQIYQKTYSPELFGNFNLEDSDKNFCNNKNIENKILLLGTFDEFSIFVSPSIFNFDEKISNDNFKNYFYPITATAANVINFFDSQKYVHYSKYSYDVILFSIFILLVLLTKISPTKKIIILFSLTFVSLSLVYLIYFFSDFYFDISKSIILMSLIQYFVTPFLLFFYISSQKEKQFELINNARIDSLISISEKIAHDIRSPISSINLSLYGLPNLKQENYEVIKNSLKRIDEIANNILKASKKNIDKNSIIFEKINLTNLIENIILEKKVINKNITYIYENNFQNEILLNKLDFERVLSNVLDNSIQALINTVNPQIKINNYVQNKKNYITIEDNGPGIADNIINLLGKYRVSTKKSESNGGVGIGVLHSKRIIESMGGSFYIGNRTEGKGTIVEISFTSSI